MLGQPHPPADTFLCLFSFLLIVSALIQRKRASLSYLQRLEDGPAVGGQFGVGGLAEELGEGGDGIQLVCRDLRQ